MNTDSPTITLRLYECTKRLPPMTEDDYWRKTSDWVLVTDNKSWRIAKYAIIAPWDENDPSTARKAWIAFGPDGEEIDFITHWAPLPKLPLKSRERVTS